MSEQEVLLKLQGNKGQSLWEIVVSLAIASLVALGLVKMTTISVKSSRFSSDQSRITALAQQKIASIIDYKNQHYYEFWGGSYYPAGFATQDYFDSYCLKTVVVDVSSQLPTTTPNYNGAKMAHIKVVVYWDEVGEGTQCDSKDFRHSLNFDTYVTN